jgi:hypothetical protein
VRNQTGVAGGSKGSELNIPRLRCRLVASTGWTFEQVDATDLCDGLALLAYYCEFPPVHELVRAYLGFEGPVVSVAEQSETLAKAVKYNAVGEGVRPYDAIPADIRAVMEAHKVN